LHAIAAHTARAATGRHPRSLRSAIHRVYLSRGSRSRRRTSRRSRPECSAYAQRHGAARCTAGVAITRDLQIAGATIEALELVGEPSGRALALIRRSDGFALALYH